MGEQSDSWAVETGSLIEDGLYDIAEDRIRIALDKNQNNSEALNAQGYLLHHKGSRNKAKAYFKRALESGPKNGRLRAEILVNLYRPKESLQVIESYLAEHPNDPLAWNTKAATLSHLGKFVEAVDCFNKTLELDSSNFYAQKYKAVYIRSFEKYYNVLICWICNRQFKGKGLEPMPLWGLATKLCRDCYKKCLEATKTRAATCTELDTSDSAFSEGLLLAFSFGHLNNIIFEPRGRNTIPYIIQNVVSCQSVKENANGGFLPAVKGIGTQYIRVDFLRDGKVHSLVFNIKEDCDSMLEYMLQISDKRES